MYYQKKNKDRIPFLTERTLAEKITGVFDMKEKPSSRQVRRFVIALIAFSLISFCNMLNATLPSIDTTEFDHGAGSTWTCSNCGKSNYVWEMGCSCGNSQ